MSITTISCMDNSDFQHEEEIERHYQIVEDETRTLHDRQLALKTISELVKRRSVCVVCKMEQEMGVKA